MKESEKQMERLSKKPFFFCPLQIKGCKALLLMVATQEQWLKMFLREAGFRADSKNICSAPQFGAFIFIHGEAHNSLTTSILMTLKWFSFSVNLVTEDAQPSIIESLMDCFISSF